MKMTPSSQILRASGCFFRHNIDYNTGENRLMNLDAGLTAKKKIYLPILYCVNISLILFSSMHILFHFNSSESIPIFIGKFLSLISLCLPVCDFYFLIPSFFVMLAVIITEVVGMRKRVLCRKEIIIFLSMNFVTFILLVSRIIWWFDVFNKGLFY
jgi:hypothetical protein